MLKTITRLLPWSQRAEKVTSFTSTNTVPYINVPAWEASRTVQRFSGTKCEVCGTEAVPVLYGLVLTPPEDKAVIGGCVISPGMARYACVNCKTRWNVGDEDYYVTFRNRLDRG